MDQILGLYLIGRECNNKNKNKDLQTSNLPSLIKPIYSTDNLTRAEDNEQMLANARLKLSYQNPTLMVNKLINIPMNQQPNGGRTYKDSSLKQTFRPKIIEYFENESKEKKQAADKLADFYKPLTTTPEPVKGNLAKGAEKLSNLDNLEPLIGGPGINEQPFFSGKTYGTNPDDYQHLINTSQRKLELFTGSANNPQWRPKTERRPLFNPMIGLTHVYGTPVQTDLYDGRYIPSRERRNEKPFQEVRETPGLNLGYNEAGLHGLHDPYRALPRSIDQLRTLSNPRITYNNPMGQLEGINVFQRYNGGDRATLPNVVKRHPERTHNIIDRDFNPESYFKKAAVFGEPMKKATNNRGAQETNHVGPAALNVSKETVGGQLTKTKIPELGTVPVGAAYLTTANAQAYFDRKNAVPNPTNRNLYNAEAIGNPEMFTKSQLAYNRSDITPGPTNRNLYNAEAIGNPEMFTKSQLAYNRSDITPGPTIRNLSNAEAIGNPGMFTKSQMAYNSVDITPGPTIRNLSNAEAIGNPGMFTKSQLAYNSVNITPDPTIRNLSNAEAIGNPGMFTKSQLAYNSVDITPDPTLRNLSNAEAIGNPGMFTKSQLAYNRSDITPDPTLRNLYNAEAIGNPGMFTKSQLAYNRSDITPDPTLRNLSNAEAIGAVAPAVIVKPALQEAGRNARLNDKRAATVKTGRKPTNSAETLGPTAELTAYRLKNPLIATNAASHAGILWSLGPMHPSETRSKQPTDNVSTGRFFEDIDSLSHTLNPLVNNVVFSVN